MSVILTVICGLWYNELWIGKFIISSVIEDYTTSNTSVLCCCWCVCFFGVFLRSRLDNNFRVDGSEWQSFGPTLTFSNCKPGYAIYAALSPVECDRLFKDWLIVWGPAAYQCWVGCCLSVRQSSWILHSLPRPASVRTETSLRRLRFRCYQPAS